MEGQPLVILPESLISDIPASYRNQPALDQSTKNFYYLLGTLRTREGWRQLGLTTDGLNITGMFAFQGQDGTFNLITASTDHVYKSASPNYGTLTDITGGTVLTLADTGATIFAPLLDLVKSGFVATNNKDLPYLWKLGDATRTILSNAPISRSVCMAMVGISNSRMVFGGISGFPSRVRWSALADPTAYPATAIADLLATPDRIVAVRAFTRGVFAIYKDRSQWLGIAQDGSDASAFRFELIDRQPGPIGPGAIYDGPHNSHVYLGNDGNIYQFDGSSSRIMSRTSDLRGVLFDAARTENNTILYDTRRNVIDAWLWPAIDTGTANLVTIASGCDSNSLKTITFRSLATAASSTVTKPSGTVTGDLLIAFTNSNSPNFPSGPVGWIQDAGVGTATKFGSIWHHVATAIEPANYAFPGATSIAMLRYDGNDTNNNTVFASPSNVSTFSPTTSEDIPEVTATTPKQLIFAAIHAYNGSVTFLWDAPYAERLEFQEGSLSSSTADQVLQTAGSPVGKTVVLSLSVAGSTLTATYRAGRVGQCIGLIYIHTNPGVFGLVTFGSFNIGLIHSFNTGQIYQQTVLPKRMRALQILSDVASRSRVAGLDASICVDDAEVDSFLGSLDATISINLPVVPGAEHEVDAIELYFDTHTTNESIPISVFAGKTPATLTETVISASGLGGLDRKIARGVNIRGRYIRAKIAKSLTSSLKINRLEITTWVRALQTD